MKHSVDDTHRHAELSANSEAKALTAEIMTLVMQLHKRVESDEEKQWLRDHCQNPALHGLLKNLTTMMIHVLDTVGQYQPLNGAAISKQMAVPKGTVSKVTRRLVKNELLAIEYLPANKKEVLFRLTPLGQELFALHRTLHQKMEAGLETFYQRYDLNQLRLVVHFLQDGLASPWIEPD